MAAIRKPNRKRMPRIVRFMRSSASPAPNLQCGVREVGSNLNGKSTITDRRRC